MLAMRIYKVKVSNAVSADLDELARFIAAMYRPESGHNYVNRILGQLAALSYTADIYTQSRYAAARRIHPKAKTLSIMNHRWTVIFHIEVDTVVVDRILPSKMIL